VSFNLCKGFVRAGIEVDVLTTNRYKDNEPFTKEFQCIDGINIFYFKNLFYSLAWHYKKCLPLGFSNFLKTKISTYDVVIISATRHFMAIQTVSICCKNKVPYIFIPFGSLQSSQNIIYRTYDAIFTRRMIKYASCSIAQNPHEADLLKSHNSKTIEEIYLPIDVNKLNDYAVHSGRFRIKHNILDSDILIGTIARFHKFKGHKYLIQLFKKISERIPNCKMIIAGRDDGYEKDILYQIKNNRLSKRIIFLNQGIYKQEKIDLLVDLDIFILTPSFYEETATASLEAAYFNTAVFVNQKTYAPELEKYHAGFYLSNDLEKDSSLISNIISAGSYKVIKLNSKKWILDTYSLDVIIKRYIKIIKELSNIP